MHARKFSRKSFYHALEPFQAKRGSDKAVGTFLATLIILNIVAVMLETVPSLYRAHHDLFVTFDVFSVIVFTLEYFARIWIVPEGKSEGSVFKMRLKYLFTPAAIIDLLAILPFYLPLFFTVDLRYLRALRLFRIVRIFKLGRYSRSMQQLSQVVRLKAPDLVIAFSFGFILLIISSTSMYFFEHEAQPEAFSSIPAAMWWAIATLTTVGYGDVYPITVGGKIFGSLVAVLGVGLVAIPTGILGAGLVESIELGKGDQGPDQLRCPHCGELIDGSQEAESIVPPRVA